MREASQRPLTLPDGDGRRRRARAGRGRRASDAFRSGMIVSGLLMIAGGIIAAVGIQNPRAEDLPAAARRPEAASV